MQRPIFIVGCPRSGTTLLHRMLDQHPSISSGSESFILESLYNLERHRWTELQALAMNQAQWRQRVRDLFSSIQEQRAIKRGKTRWADKTPSYGLILDYIDDLYPDCQVIHVIRNPRDVIDSWRRRVGPVRARDAVHAWPTHIRAAREFRDTRPADRYSEVRYEELVAEPEKIAKGLIEWLGEPWDDRVIHLKEKKRSKPRAPEEREQRQRARWLGQLNEPEPVIDDQQLKDTPVQPEAWPIMAQPSQIVASSVGVGSNGKNFFINVPYLIELQRIAGPLVKELGYDLPFQIFSRS